MNGDNVIPEMFFCLGHSIVQDTQNRRVRLFHHYHYTKSQGISIRTNFCLYKIVLAKQKFQDPSDK